MTDTARLEVGDKAPGFSLLDADGKTVKLSDFKGRKVIVYFYPAAMTPGCTKQACDFRDSLAELNGAGVDVVGISPDKPEKLAKFRDRDGLTFPLLSDLRGRHVIVYFYPAAMTPGCTTQACDFRDNLASLQGAGYAVVGVSPDGLDKLKTFVEAEHLTFPLASDPDRSVLEAWGAWGEKSLYGKTVTGVIRSTVVVDPEGRVELAQYNVKATGHVAKLRRDLKVA